MEFKGTLCKFCLLLLTLESSYKLAVTLEDRDKDIDVCNNNHSNIELFMNLICSF